MAAHIARFMLCGSRSLPKSHPLITSTATARGAKLYCKGKKRFGNGTASFTGTSTIFSPSSSSAEEKQQFSPSYEPCLLLSYELIPYGTKNTVSYTFYHLKYKKIMKKMKQVVSPRDTEHLLPDGSYLISASYCWLAFMSGEYNKYGEIVILINPSLPLYCSKISLVDDYYTKGKIALFNPQEFHSHSDLNDDNDGVAFLDNDSRICFRSYDGASYRDLMYFSKRKQFFCLRDTATVLDAWSHYDDEPWTSMQTFFSSRKPDEGRIKGRYLVELSSGNLLLVISYIAEEVGYPIKPDISWKTTGFEVYQFEFEEQKWEPVECLDDHALFVTYYKDSFSLCTSDYPYVKNNCIYFVDEDEDDFGIFNLYDSSIERIHVGDCERDEQSIRDYGKEWSSKVKCPLVWLMVDVGAM